MVGLISALILIPLAGAIALYIGQPKNARTVALIFNALSAFYALLLWQRFDATAPGLQIAERHAWIPSIGAEYLVGVDGLSLLLVLLTSLLFPFAFCAQRLERGACALMLVMQAALYGTFTAQNFVLWFLFYEMSLIPAFLLIKIYGGENRDYAAIKFFLYTFLGSVSMLLAFLGIYLSKGTFDFAPLAAWAQRDLKRMVAYLSINHLGYCLLGLFAIAARSTSALIDKHAAFSGVFLQIFNHGITAAALFYYVGLLEQRRGARGLNDFGGLMQRTPLLCGWMSVAMFSSLGLPGLNGFIGEFLIFKGSFALAASFTAIAVIGLLVTAIAFARAMQTLFSGPLAESCRAFPDLLRSEKLVVVPITLLMFAIGIAPQFVLNIFNTTVVHMTRLFA